MDLSLYEQETIINFCEEEKTAGIYTHNKPLRRKLESLALDRPEDCRLVRVSHDGRAADYIIPKAWVKIIPPRVISEAQRAALVNRGRPQINGCEACSCSVSPT